MVGLDVKAMRSTKQEHQLKHLANSREVFLALVDKVRSFDRAAEARFVAERDYEGLEMFVLRHLLGT
jgi:xylose isomerase